MSIVVRKAIPLRSLPSRVIRQQDMRPFVLPPDAYPGHSHAGLLQGLNGASLVRFEYGLVVPPVRLLHYVVENGTFLVGHRLDGTVLTEDGRAILETAAFRDRQEAGRHDEVVVETGPVGELDEVFVGFDGAWRNYFHFLCFAMVKSFLADRLLDPSIAIALPDYDANTGERPASFGRSVFDQCIEASGVSGRVVCLPPGAYRARRVHLFWTSPGEPTDIMHLDAFRDMFDAIASSVRAGGPTHGIAEAPPERIYLARSRSVASRLDDRAAVLIDEAAERHGFRRISFEGMDLRQQVSIVSSASHLLSPHGAGLSNMMFNPGALQVLELNRPLDGGTSLRPWFLLAARARGLPYRYLDTGDPGFGAVRINDALSDLLRP